MFRVVTLFRVLSSILLFKHRYPVGAKHPPPRELRFVLRLLKDLPFVCGDGRGRTGVSHENTKKFRRACSVHAFFLVVVKDEERERETERERQTERERYGVNEKEKQEKKIKKNHKHVASTETFPTPAFSNPRLLPRYGYF